MQNPPKSSPGVAWLSAGAQALARLLRRALAKDCSRSTGRP